MEKDGFTTRYSFKQSERRHLWCDVINLTNGTLLEKKSNAEKLTL